MVPLGREQYHANHYKNGCILLFVVFSIVSLFASATISFNNIISRSHDYLDDTNTGNETVIPPIPLQNGNNVTIPLKNSDSATIPMENNNNVTIPLENSSNLTWSNLSEINDTLLSDIVAHIIRLNQETRGKPTQCAFLKAPFFYIPASPLSTIFGDPSRVYSYSQSQQEAIRRNLANRKKRVRFDNSRARHRIGHTYSKAEYQRGIDPNDPRQTLYQISKSHELRMFVFQEVNEYKCQEMFSYGKKSLFPVNFGDLRAFESSARLRRQRSLYKFYNNINKQR